MATSNSAGWGTTTAPSDMLPGRDEKFILMDENSGRFLEARLHVW